LKQEIAAKWEKDQDFKESIQGQFFTLFEEISGSLTKEDGKRRRSSDLVVGSDRQIVAVPKLDNGKEGDNKEKLASFLAMLRKNKKLLKKLDDGGDGLSDIASTRSYVSTAREIGIRETPSRELSEMTFDELLDKNVVLQRTNEKLALELVEAEIKVQEAEKTKEHLKKLEKTYTGNLDSKDKEIHDLEEINRSLASKIPVADNENSPEMPKRVLAGGDRTPRPSLPKPDLDISKNNEKILIAYQNLKDKNKSLESQLAKFTTSNPEPSKVSELQKPNLSIG
jgi:hypothetical protein